jgi:hypothetical protein
MQSTDRQVRKLMDEYQQHGHVGRAALRAAMDRKTARRYLRAGKLPSELGAPRAWRTRGDPFAEDWAYIRDLLGEDPDLEALTIFEHLCELSPEQYQEGQLRTLQRRLKQWRAEEGPPRELFFAQAHRPGEAMQTDFTWGNELGVTIGGERFPHLLCHAVLPYSNWEWLTVCQSESMVALKRGVQAALFELGHVPRFHQTDNSTAATHDLRRGLRGFNQAYLDFMAHFGMTPRTTEVGEKEQNGDVESAHGALKRAVKQRLKLERRAEFGSVAAYEEWLQGLVRLRNRRRQRRLEEELAVMKCLRAERVAEFTEEEVGVSQGSTIAVRSNVYSVPSRLRGEKVRVRIYEDRLEVYYAQKRQLTVERLRGRGGHRINYRHVISSLVRKPGAFQRYRYREDLFPSLVFRRAYDVLADGLPERRADIEYLNCLKLAAETMECEVEAALAMLLEAGELPRAEAVRELVQPGSRSAPVVELGAVDLRSYDALLEGGVREVAS